MHIHAQLIFLNFLLAESIFCEHNEMKINSERWIDADRNDLYLGIDEFHNIVVDYMTHPELEVAGIFKRITSEGLVVYQRQVDKMVYRISFNGSELNVELASASGRLIRRVSFISAADIYDVYADLPKSESASGLFKLNEHGHRFVAKMSRSQDESLEEWLTRLKEKIRGVSTNEGIVQNFDPKFGLTIPPELKDLWRITRSIVFDDNYDIVYEPSHFLEVYSRGRKFIPQLGSDRIFIGGGDGIEYALFEGSNADPPKVVRWDHETGFEVENSATFEQYIIERIASLATSGGNSVEVLKQQPLD
ncbi:MAG: hypothetical protein ACI8UO_003948 [Verrucomicrobiales bacterium]|jgi:hypothetical protein